MVVENLVGNILDLIFSGGQWMWKVFGLDDFSAMKNCSYNTVEENFV
jgi:hypothetical protein